VDLSNTIQGRLFIVGEEIIDMQIFVYELRPYTTERLSLQEWAEMHIQGCYDADSLRELFSLPAEGDFQVLFTATLRGWIDSFTGEADEEMTIIESTNTPIPAAHFGSSLEINE
jgi:hypothetical protein